MLRYLTIIALMTTFGAAFALYAVKDDTRKLRAHVQAQDRLIKRHENDIAILKAERAHLARPGRIDELARRQGLGPTRSGQYGRLRDMPMRSKQR